MRLAHLTATVVAVAIAAGAWFWYSGHDSAPSVKQIVDAVTSPVGEASRLAATARAQAASAVLEQLAAQNGTYAGATTAALRQLDPTLDPSVTVVSASDAGYCVQAGFGADVAHVTGPGGVAQPGPCPA